MSKNMTFLLFLSGIPNYSLNKKYLNEFKEVIVHWK